MTPSDKLNQLKKLLKTLVFDKYDIDFDITDYPKNAPRSEFRKYRITVYVDPYKYLYNFTGGDDKYWNAIEFLEEKIDNALKYIGIDFFNVELVFEFESLEKLESEITSLIDKNWQQIEKLYRNRTESSLPAIEDIAIFQVNTTTPHIELVLYFEPEMFDKQILWNILMNKFNLDDFLVSVEYAKPK